MYIYTQVASLPAAWGILTNLVQLDFTENPLIGVKNVTLVPPSLLQESFSEVFSNVYSDRHRLQ